MKHTNHQEQVSLYLDGLLGDKASATLFAHLADCTECRSLLRISLSLRGHVAEEDLADTSLTLDRRILGSNPAGGRNTKQPAWYAPVWFTRISVPLPAAASIVFLIIVGSLLFSPLLSQEQKQETEIPKPFVDKIPPMLRTPFSVSK